MRDRVSSFFMLVPGPWHDAPQLARSLSERKQGRPLTQTEVEELGANSSAIAMEPADAQQQRQRSRGYDLLDHQR